MSYLEENKENLINAIEGMEEEFKKYAYEVLEEEFIKGENIGRTAHLFYSSLVGSALISAGKDFLIENKLIAELKEGIKND